MRSPPDSSRLNSAKSPQSAGTGVKRVLVKFILGDRSRVVDVGDCEGGVAILQRGLKKIMMTGGGALAEGSVDETDEGGLTVDGWGAYMDGRGQFLISAIS